MTTTAAKTVTSIRRNSAPRVLLASRALVDKHDAGLTSIAGAREIIAAIRARRAVTKLILGHNDLGDNGCKELFRFLCTEDGRRYRIAEISLNSNGISDDGLDSIADYLVGNAHLKEIFLQNNAFQGGTSIALKLSSAINSSGLELLSLTNQRFSASFFTTFLSYLDSSSLRELQISALGLTPASAPALTSFLTSPRSRALETLKCNGNSLGMHAIRTLISSVRESNFTIQKLEVHASGPAVISVNTWETFDNVAANENVMFDSRALWNAIEQDLKKVLLRNEMLRRKVHDEALALLSYARALLLNTACRSHNHSQSSLSLRQPTSPSPSDTPVPSFPFTALPTELKHHVLSFLAPALSSAQRVRIYAFAASPTTLRPLLPSLKSDAANADARGGCIPDPASLPFGMMGIPGEAVRGLAGMPIGMGMGISGLTRPAAAAAPPRLRLCEGGRCMGVGGSVLCHRNEARLRWLKEVGCIRFEADGRFDADVLHLL